MIPDPHSLMVILSTLTLFGRELSIGELVVIITVIANLGISISRISVNQRSIEDSRKADQEMLDSIKELQKEIRTRDIQMENRVTIVESSVRAAHHRLDGRGPDVDWGRIMGVLEKVYEAERERGGNLEQLLRELVRRSA